MYLLNDGKRLELDLKNSMLFSSPEERADAIRTIAESKLPLKVALNGNRDMAPLEVQFLRSIMDTVRSIGGEVRFTSKKAS